MMKVLRSLLVALSLCQPSVGVVKKSLRGQKTRNAQANVLQDSCLVLSKVARIDHVDITTFVCQLMGIDAENFGALFLEIEGANLEWASKHGIISGASMLTGGAIQGRFLQLLEGYSIDTPSRKNRRLVSSSGTKSVLVVRVKADDSSTTASSSLLSDKIFGTSGDSVNMRSQYRACSGNKLRMEPTSHSKASNGVYTVSIDKSVKGKPEVEVEDWVTRKMEQDFGSNFGDLFDHVMYCLPQGVSTGSWVGYAYINHWLSVFNDEWCERVSGQMHEVGHNLGLAHSGESNGYDDQSGLMGFSYQADNTRMCFNGAKSWQLGWYSDRHATATGDWSGDLVGVADYGSGGSKTVILQIQGSGVDHYATFNRKNAINSDTQEGGDQVLLTERPTGNDYAESTLVAKLGVGQEYSMGGGRKIKVNSINSNVAAWYANVSVTGNGGAPPTPNPPTPTPPPPTPNPPTPTPPPPTPQQDTGGCSNITFINTCLAKGCKWNSGTCW